MAKKKYKMKKKPIIVLVAFCILIIGIFFGINRYKLYKYHQTIEYKLLTVGYKDDEVKLLMNTLDKEYYEKLIEEKKNETLLKLLKEKYFIKNNLDRYLKYCDKNKDKKISDVISIVNVNADYQWYEHDIDTTLLDFETIVNKYYKLPESYKPEDIVRIATQYAYEDNSIRQAVYDKYKEMWNAAKKAGFELIVTSSYRSEIEQQKTYDAYEDTRGSEYADGIAARPRYSEHQTGLALDILTPGVKAADFSTTEAYNWLQSNAHLYGFILRYPEGKEYLTGYNYESWHYRYLGVELATKVHSEGITYDEYYAYYIAK